MEESPDGDPRLVLQMPQVTAPDPLTASLQNPAFEALPGLEHTIGFQTLREV